MIVLSIKIEEATKERIARAYREFLKTSTETPSLAAFTRMVLDAGLTQCETQ